MSTLGMSFIEMACASPALDIWLIEPFQDVAPQAVPPPLMNAIQEPPVAMAVASPQPENACQPLTLKVLLLLGEPQPEIIISIPWLLMAILVASPTFETCIGVP